MSGSVHFGFDITSDNLKAFEDALREMQAQDVLAGYPADKAEPREDQDDNPVPITNAAIAYLMNTGMPEQNVPAREFMVSGIESVEQPIISAMEQTGIAALGGESQAVEQGLNAVGLIAQNGIRSKIVDGPFEPLAESTLRGRVRHGGAIGKAAQTELDSRAVGNEPSVDNARPLNFTGQMRNAATYVLRKRE
jgi:hypothetical protein